MNEVQYVQKVEVKQTIFSEIMKNGKQYPKAKHFLLINKTQKLLLVNDKYKLKPQNFFKTMIIKK